MQYIYIIYIAYYIAYILLNYPLAITTLAISYKCKFVTVAAFRN